MIKTKEGKAHKRNYYQEIDYSINRYENGLYPVHDIDWICSRIDWCWKFRHITETQMNELADRICNVMTFA